MMAAETLLDLRAVSHFFGSRLIFKGVSCVLEPAGIMLVAGPNGAGKSTLLKIMAGLLSPRSGSVRRSVENRDMAFMGHQTFVYPALSALGNLEFWNRVYGRGLDDAGLLGLLDRVGLKGFALEAAAYTERTCIIVVEVAGSGGSVMMGIVVDAVSEVLNIRGADIENTPAFGVRLNTDFILGMAKAAGGIKILLDIDKVLSSEDIVAVRHMA